MDGRVKLIVLDKSINPRNLARLLMKKSTKAAKRAGLKGEAAERFKLKYMAAINAQS
jgi:hypothetical protein